MWLQWLKMHFICEERKLKLLLSRYWILNKNSKNVQVRILRQCTRSTVCCYSSILAELNSNFLCRQCKCGHKINIEKKMRWQHCFYKWSSEKKGIARDVNCASFNINYVRFLSAHFAALFESIKHLFLKSACLQLWRTDSGIF